MFPLLDPDAPRATPLGSWALMNSSTSGTTSRSGRYWWTLLCSPHPSHERGQQRPRSPTQFPVGRVKDPVGKIGWLLFPSLPSLASLALRVSTNSLTLTGLAPSAAMNSQEPLRQLVRSKGEGRKEGERTQAQEPRGQTEGDPVPGTAPGMHLLVLLPDLPALGLIRFLSQAPEGGLCFLGTSWL